MKKFIEAVDVRVGDHIKVTFSVDDLTITRAGVVAETGELDSSGARYFRTEKGYSLGPGDVSADIQLLNRAQIKLPTGEHAVIQYDKGDVCWVGTRLTEGDWSLYSYYKGVQSGYPWIKDTAELAEMVNRDSRTGFKVLFEGVSK